ncbi:D-amino acid dehydrogenase, small subunit; similar to dadA [Cupriavidus taiwanensis]|uniref:D-amino acid dehydrogenase, small subunit similar to dadA n=1 Tax=Cupriavidus taiwanensis TaxID=164546 RepID=A0A976B328_9BURK|nr:D-amino acid dehydrogenase [Cupriavidus taiwanensis]SOZ69060.1 D-amino acid dehydrogenase, small subunit; similar to dadA [Cupriavidus taiwanensis]SOZ70172.1 D-amino acid dehydrogenase, small subunit; similar to dadA [Cupriavidus taiwanensis]SOZ73040.1 D-amino acid dehydrogenase, small subunit; similar to dadA [Cupriavidus taiwanensis]SPA02885.1 D-amino acid dehydrogenase, small subunit; similar to dadA [Cupriavidus taiwanensis]SPA09942.1 D-amino acid dehydrogenase, small subunit; similar t
MKTIAVIGGGITGVTTAYALARRGFSVTLFERHRYAAMETSFANGGQLSASNAEVWTHWSTIVKGMKWMLRNDAPLLVNPRPTWHKLSWFAEFIASIPHYRRNTIETARLAIAAREHLFAWAAQEGIDFDLKRAGILHIYRDRAGFEHAGRVSALLAQGGLERRAVTPQEMLAIEPTLAGSYYGGYFTESDSTGDIHKFTSGLAAAAARLGVRCLYGQDVRAVTTDGRRATITVQDGNDSTSATFDGAVICAGTASRALAAALGDRVNIYPVKGYSITVNLTDEASRAAAPVVSLLDDETKLVTSRLGDDRFRVAGTAEFNGTNRDIRADRIRPLVDWVQQCFPGVSTRSVVPWAGLRPMMPDMLPRVGRGRAACIFYNTGHGHLGWTLSAVTADMVAGVVDQAMGSAPAMVRGAALTPVRA